MTGAYHPFGRLMLSPSHLLQLLTVKGIWGRGVDQQMQIFSLSLCLSLSFLFKYIKISKISFITILSELRMEIFKETFKYGGILQLILFDWLPPWQINPISPSSLLSHENVTIIEKGKDQDIFVSRIIFHNTHANFFGIVLRNPRDGKVNQPALSSGPNTVWHNSRADLIFSCF